MWEQIILCVQPFFVLVFSKSAEQKQVLLIVFIGSDSIWKNTDSRRITLLIVQLIQVWTAIHGPITSLMR
jgi:hypothetical protein